MFAYIKGIMPICFLALLLLLTPGVRNRLVPSPNMVAAAPQAWTEVDDFESLGNGALGSRNNWSSTGGLSITTDPADGQNQILQVSGAESYGSKTLPTSIQTDSFGTLFFRMRRSGSVDAFGGLSNDFSPTQWENFEAQFGGQSATPGNFSIRNGDDFYPISGGFQNETWYCVWMVPDLSSAYYFMYVQGGQYEEQTGLQNSSRQFFFFRNGDNSTMTTFFTRSGLDAGGTLMLDDIYVDAAGFNTDTPGGVSCPQGDPVSGNPNQFYQLVDTFNGYSSGSSLDSQGSWAASGVTVQNDPTGGSNRVMALAGTNSFARKLFPDNGAGGNGIPNNDTGSIFFRMYRDGVTNAYGGGSDFSSADFFDDYKVQFGSDGNENGNGNDFTARDGDFFRHGADFADGAWHCVWMIVDNTSENYGVWVKGGNYAAAERMILDSQSLFDFRNGGTSSSISTFLALSGPGSGTLYIDDIYVNPGLDDFSQPGGSCNQVISQPDIDLEITSAFFTSSFSGNCTLPGQSGSIQLGVNIRNNGTEWSGSFNLTAAGQTQFVNGLSGGASTTIFFDGTFSSSLSAEVDSSDQVDETNESNNSFNDFIPIPTARPTCTPTPINTHAPTVVSNQIDLTIQSIQFRLPSTSSCYIIGDLTQPGLEVTVRNAGTQAAGPFEVRAGGIAKNINGIQAQSTAKLFFEEINPNGGAQVTIEVDPSNMVAESNEDNNNVTQSAPISTPTVPHCTATPPPTVPPTLILTPDAPLLVNVYLSMLLNKFSNDPTHTPTPPELDCLDEDDEPNDSSFFAAQKPSICFEQFVEGSLDKQNDIKDVYYLKLDNPTDLRINLDSYPQNALFALTLFKAAGGLVEHKADLADFQEILLGNQAAGDYLVQVIIVEGEGPYRLFVSID